MLFLSCNQANKKEIETEMHSPKEIHTIDKLIGRWLEEADSLHIIEFTESKMIEEYNGSKINSYPFVIFNGLPGKGGYEAVSGRVVHIEESKDHFYNFSIVVLDSNYLELLHNGSAKNQFFKRLK